jgi:hypothetical protein
VRRRERLAEGLRHRQLSRRVTGKKWRELAQIGDDRVGENNGFVIPWAAVHHPMADARQRAFAEPALDARDDVTGTGPMRWRVKRDLVHIAANGVPEHETRLWGTDGFDLAADQLERRSSEREESELDAGRSG